MIFAAGIASCWHFADGISWWAEVLWFFVPDLSFASYLFGPRMGAFGYNLMHIYGWGAALLAFGLITASPAITVVGALWLAHSGFDRMLGYGLKSSEGFSHTHLGHIGNQG